MNLLAVQRTKVAAVAIGVGLAALAGAGAEPPHDDATPVEIPKIRLLPMWPGVKLRRPIQIVPMPGADKRVFIVEQAGRVVELDPTTPEQVAASEWLDIRDRVNDANNEEGLLALAFHPKVAQNRQVYLYYCAEPPRRQVLSRMTLDTDGRPDPSSEEVLLEIADPAWNHNGGTILFGSDGYLYLSTGDGGSGNDPWGNGQNLNVLLAKVLRIDVDRAADGLPYAIPADNPFVGQAGARGEIWAYGLRNVWRMSFDRKTGDLWGGDVGQNAYEEIDLIKRGGNYGWRPREGFHATPGVPDSAEASPRFIEPVAEYPRRQGVSVTGGFVSRGAAEPALDGIYLYADYAYGNYWGLRWQGGELRAGPTIVLRKGGFFPASFGELNDGTLLVCGTEGGENGRGSVFRIHAIEAPKPVPGEIPAANQTVPPGSTSN